MTGQIDEITTDGQIRTISLSKVSQKVGPLVMTWNAHSATWMVTGADSATKLVINDHQPVPVSGYPLSHLDTIRCSSFVGRFFRIPEPPRLNGVQCRELRIGRSPVIIGRSSVDYTTQDSSTVLKLDPDDRSISKSHVRIHVEANSHVITDLSKTGTFLNGKMFQHKRLLPGDRFAVGGYLFEFTGHSIFCIDQLSGSQIRGFQLCRSVGPKRASRRILDRVDIEILSGETIGILGLSGQGKSTLMNLLAGVTCPTSGSVILDGDTVENSMSTNSVGFVPQDDIVHPELTVKDAMTLTAKLRLALDQSNIDALVIGILERLDLSRQANQPIHTLSGGQRKRVNISTELFSRPSVLFLDEPTSGLDPASEENVFETLDLLNRTGQTIVCTTHSVQRAYLFDRVAFIHQGRMVYFGTPENAKSHFSQFRDGSGTEGTGPEIGLDRVYKVLATSPDGKFLEDTFAGSVLAMPKQEKTPPPRRVIPPPPKPARPGFFKSMSVMIETQARILFSDSRNVGSLILQAAGIGLLAGWVGRDDPEFRFFVCLIAALWFGCSNAAQAIVRELPVFRRERMAGLVLAPYVLSKTVFLSIIVWLQIVMLLVAQSIPAILAPTQPGLSEHANDLLPTSAAGVLIFAVSFILSGVVGVQMGLAISSFSRSMTHATLWVPLLLIPQILFSGFVVTLPEMPMTARFFSHFVPSSGAQRLLDAGNVLSRRVPLMTEKTRVPLFFETAFERDRNGQWDILPGKYPDRLKPATLSGYNEIEEYNTAWQNIVVIPSKIGAMALPTYSDQHPTSSPRSTEDKNFLYERPDVRYRAGEIAGATEQVTLGLCTLLGWIAVCFVVIWRGLVLAQPETLQPKWVRRT